MIFKTDGRYPEFEIQVINPKNEVIQSLPLVLFPFVENKLSRFVYNPEDLRRDGIYSSVVLSASELGEVVRLIESETYKYLSAHKGLQVINLQADISTSNSYSELSKRLFQLASGSIPALTPSKLRLTLLSSQGVFERNGSFVILEGYTVKLETTLLNRQNSNSEGINKKMEIQVMSAEKALSKMYFDGVHIYENDKLIYPDYAVISIRDHSPEKPNPISMQAKGKCKAILPLHFTDLAPSYLREYGITSPCENESFGGFVAPFDKNMAASIIEFITNLPPSVKCLIVHCAAGVSRSKAVGAFVECVLNHNFDVIEEYIHESNWEYFNVLSEAYDSSLPVGYQALNLILDEPIYQLYKPKNGALNLFELSDGYAMSNQEKHLLKKGAYGPEYPPIKMISYRNKVRISELKKTIYHIDLASISECTTAVFNPVEGIGEMGFDKAYETMKLLGYELKEDEYPLLKDCNSVRDCFETLQRKVKE